jgi:hypothetical protein
MPSIYVAQLVFDEVNVAKLWSHGVTIREALEVVGGTPKAFRNHSRGAPWILIGHTASGRLPTFPLDPGSEEGSWRPRTGYDSSKKESRRYTSE